MSILDPIGVKQIDVRYDMLRCTAAHDASPAAEKCDAVAVEEPLELRLNGEPYATLMRTPGADRDLALGFFLAEGVISSSSDVSRLVLCGEGLGVESTRNVSGSAKRVVETDQLVTASGNLVDLRTAPHVKTSSPIAARLPVTSSCGVCGKRTISEVLALLPAFGTQHVTCDGAQGRPNLYLSASLLAELPRTLRTHQPLFQLTGALHGAALFDSTGKLLVVREDVGRHNAVDKVLGWALLENRLPPAFHVLQVSGRVSFEIVQKAYRAGVPCVTAVSGVSTLAVSLAERAGITLVGFVRGRSYNIYSHAERIRCDV